MSSYREATRTQYLGNSNNKAIFAGAIDPDFRMAHNNPQGGYLNAILMDAVLQRAPGHRAVAFNAFFFKLSVVGPCIVELEELKTSKNGYCVSQVALKQLSTPTPLNTIDTYDPSAYITKLHTIITTTSRPDGFSFAPLENMQPIALDFNKMQPSKFGLTGGPNTLKIYENLDNQNKGEVWHAFEWPNGEPIDAKSIACFADISTVPRPFVHKDMMYAMRASLQFEVKYRVPPPKPTQRVLLKIVMENIVDGIMDADGWLFDQDGYLLGTARHHIALTEKKPSL
ncbi:hypothetical protein BDA99DRAFT_181082 [Phascolomyces articulosus]|uniref:Acyl-CoA thioesterase-like C-terminal domain-containing protein n=1 Tax=Phascolomyces articulosus TaxID=60185 RepID=A0AAD5PAL6_9FUNG|nr:hypothetical protein BDA99DRAFT_181082 [Phascolomyces articulosus]